MIWEAAISVAKLPAQVYIVILGLESNTCVSLGSSFSLEAALLEVVVVGNFHLSS